MQRTTALVQDTMTRARLHAALDAVLSTQQMLQQIHESSRVAPSTVARLSSLVSEARALLGALLDTPAPALTAAHAGPASIR